MEKQNGMLETAGTDTPPSYLDYSSGQFSFIPTPVFSPTWPTKGTLTHKALAILMRGEPIDHPTFMKINRSWRLSACICQLRKLGWPVETLRTPSRTKDTPDRGIALYSMAIKGVANGT